MATIKEAIATKASITCTLTSLANSSAQQSTAIDNTTNLYDDALVRIKTNGQTSGTGLLVVYAYAALDDTTYTDGASGTDGSFTAASILNSPILATITMNASTGVVAGPFSVASVFGGRLPAKWGLIFKNSSGAALSATAADHDIAYNGITYTVV